MYKYVYRIFCIKSYRPNSSGSLGIAIKMKARKIFVWSQSCLFIFYKQKRRPPNKLHVYWRSITVHNFMTLNCLELVLLPPHKSAILLVAVTCYGRVWWRA
jgi:hypothetical protein